MTWYLSLPLLAALSLSCQRVEDPAAPIPTAVAQPATSLVQFVDVAAAVGLDWRHENGHSARRHFPETMGGGGALFDYDGDGDLDIYAINGAFVAPAAPAATAGNALFRNDGPRFTPVDAGVDHPGVGMGVAAADYDGDGDLDFYLTNFGANELYRNDGARFRAVGAASGVDDPRWGTSCAFADYDRDGDLDLYVANYVAYDPDAQADAAIPYMAAYDSYAGQKPPGYPHPDNFPGQADALFRNDGDGRFADVSARAGIADDGGKGLGVVFADYDQDGWPDLYVANDAVRNFLYRNGRDGTFEDKAALLGVAYGQDGQMEAGMGVDWGDYDGDGILDLTVTNFQAEPNALYRGENGFFSVATYAAGVGLPSLPLLGFGTQFFDPDLDGDLDLFAANGHVLDNVGLVDQSTSYGQRNLLLRNDGGRFADISATAGPGFALARVSRGSAAGDWDRDGDPDLLVFNSGQPLSLLRNDLTAGHHWLTIRLQGSEANIHGIGARLTAAISAADGAPLIVQTRELRGSRSYLSQSPLSATFGLGPHPRIDSLHILWPSGRSERFGPLDADQVFTLVEGNGVNAAADPP